MRKKNGFTLIELLAIIIILGIVAGIAIYFSGGLINKSKEKTYVTTREGITSSAVDYLKENNSNFIPSVDNDLEEYQCVTVKDLINSGFFDKNIVKSKLSSNTRVTENTFIYVTRNKNSKVIISSIIDEKEKCGKLNKYNINYKDCGNTSFSGTHGENYPKTYFQGEEKALDIPTKKDYTFYGYYASSDCTGSYVTSIESTFKEDITYYAKWETTKDSTPPSIPTFISIYADGSGKYNNESWSNKEIYTTISSSDTGSGVANIQYATLENPTSWTNLSFNVSSLKQDGNFWSGTESWALIERDDTYYFRACDNAGNCSNASEAFNIRYDFTAPVVNISLTSYKSFRWNAVDNNEIVGVILSDTQTEKPAVDSASWDNSILSSEKSVATSSKETYYVWAKDAAGNISDAKSITNYVINRNVSNGTSMTIKDTTNSKSIYSSNNTTYALSGSTLNVTGSVTAGFNTLSLKKGTEIITNNSNHTITSDTTFYSSATANSAVITINKNGTPYNGYNVNLYQNGTRKYYGYDSANNIYTFSGVVNGTYDIYIGGADSGRDITVNGNGSQIIDFYSVSLSKGNGISTVTKKLDSGFSPEADFYISGSTISIDATLRSGYTFNGWTKSSDGSLVSNNKEHTSQVSSSWAYVANAESNLTCTIGSNHSTDYGDDVTLTINTTGNSDDISYSWDNGNTYGTSNTKTYKSSGTINVKVKNSAGNEASCNITISSSSETKYHICYTYFKYCTGSDNKLYDQYDEKKASCKYGSPGICTADMCMCRDSEVGDAAWSYVNECTENPKYRCFTSGSKISPKTKTITAYTTMIR